MKVLQTKHVTLKNIIKLGGTPVYKYCSNCLNFKNPSNLICHFPYV